MATVTNYPIDLPILVIEAQIFVAVKKFPFLPNKLIPTILSSKDPTSEMEDRWNLDGFNDIFWWGHKKRNCFWHPMFQWLWWLKGRLWWAGRVQPPGGHASNWKPRKKWPLGLLFSIVQYKTGGEGEQGHVKFTDILEWEPILRKWKRLGSLKQGRYLHICHH